MDLALDEIIKKNSPGRGGRGGGRRGGAVGGGRGGGASNRGLSTNRRSPRGGAAGGGRFSQIRQARNVPEGRWNHDRYNDDFENGGGGGKGRFGLRSAGAALNATTKLLISNLDFGVSDSDINELFGEFGPVRRAAVHYDKSGRSLGSADVVFERRADAVRAVKQYNSVPLDGRPMKIQLVGLNQTSAPPTATAFGNNRMRGSNLRIQGRSSRGGGGGGGGRGGGGGGRGRGGGGGRGRQARKEPPSQAELDADLDAYINKME